MNETDLLVLHSGALGLNPLYFPLWFVRLMADARHALVAWVALAPLLALALAWRRAAAPAPGAGWRAQAPGALLALTALALSLLVHQFPDEVFGNLIQSRHLAADGRYSFRADANVDGSVDLLFYALVAAFGALGCDVPLAALLLGAAAVAVTVLLLHAFALRETGDPRLAWLASALACGTPALSGVGGAGWSSAFAGLLAALSISLWFSARWRWAFAATGALSLLRFDFAYYTALVGAGLVLTGRRWPDRPLRDRLRAYAASLGCVAAVLAFWPLYYGHLLPTPIVMKAGLGGSLPRLLDAVRGWEQIPGTGNGLAGLLLELSPALAATAVGLGRLPRGTVSFAAWLVPAGLHLLLVLWAGGDYMPHHRYYTILLVAFLFLGARGLGALPARLGAAAPLRWLAGERWAFPRRALAGLAAALAACALPIGAGLTGTVAENLGGLRYAWFGTGVNGMIASRIANHTLTGRFFGAVAPPGWTLASLEVASAFYFFPGASIDVQGFMNRDVAAGPAHPAPRAAWDRRLDTGVWERERPSIVWLDTVVLSCEPAHAQALFEVLRAAGRMRTRPQANRLMLASSNHWWWTEPYFDSAWLLGAYVARPTVVDGYALLYLVRADLAAEHDARLARAGFRVAVRVPAPARPASSPGCPVLHLAGR